MYSNFDKEKQKEMDELKKEHKKKMAEKLKQDLLKSKEYLGKYKIGKNKILHHVKNEKLYHMRESKLLQQEIKNRREFHSPIVNRKAELDKFS